MLAKLIYKYIAEFFKLKKITLLQNCTITIIFPYMLASICPQYGQILKEFLSYYLQPIL